MNYCKYCGHIINKEYMGKLMGRHIFKYTCPNRCINEIFKKEKDNN